ncbi:MAG: DUF3006 domain-containing protein [Ruminococcaceae bacterium]|nr:DUF3006 domain-containing protein [Oscillospiraceae bacterium]
MKKIFSIDRAEGELFVCVSDDDDTVNVKKELLGGMQVHDVFSAILDGDKLTDITPMPDERDRRLEANREILKRLIERSKKF